MLYRFFIWWDNPKNMRLLFKIILLFFALNTFAQDTIPTTVRDTIFFSKIDSLYREDQFYFGLTYNQLMNSPKGFSQDGISTGINVGFLRDMPINKKRTLAFALGLGLSYNKYHTDLKVSETGGARIYEIVDEDSFSRNKMEQVFVDLPIEFRWRNSTPESHKFWRVYTGFKVRYLALSKIKYVASGETINILNNKDFNKLQFGPYLSFGYNTWNFHAYYGLNSLYKSAKTVDGESMDFTTLNIGLMFYIL